MTTELMDDETPNEIDFEIIDSRIFSESDYTTTFLIDGIMTEGQPQLYGGPSKSMKTSVLVDQCLSLAAGVPFLGRYAVPKSKRVLLLSSESGTATLQETARRICKDKGIDLAELGDQLHWGFRPPQLTDAQHIATLRAIILEKKIDVLPIDPAYLSMNLVGNEMANQFAVGAVLANLSRLHADTGVTPVLATHFRMGMKAGVMPSLEHIAGAGFGQWARQWVLLNRRIAFNTKNPGSHKLHMTFGGSAGHAGANLLDIEEGRIEDGRFWQVSVSDAATIGEHKKTARQETVKEGMQQTRKNREAAIITAIRRFSCGESKTKIKEATGLNAQNFNAIFDEWIGNGKIEPCVFDRGEKKKDGTLRTYPGFKLVEPTSLSKPDTQTQSDTPGHCPMVSA